MEDQLSLGTRRQYELQRLMEDVLDTGRTIRSATRAARRSRCRTLADRTREQLEPHAAVDEPGLEAIKVWLEALAATDPGDVDRIQELLYGLDALVRVHIWRETELELEPPRGRSMA
jgi:Asp-tRNA(Asn)/Glu-tRNA(Gln) amidotransferase B subunit